MMCIPNEYISKLNKKGVFINKEGKIEKLPAGWKLTNISKNGVERCLISDENNIIIFRIDKEY